jgi:hypothetical protein
MDSHGMSLNPPGLGGSNSLLNVKSTLASQTNVGSQTKYFDFGGGLSSNNSSKPSFEPSLGKHPASNKWNSNY